MLNSFINIIRKVIYSSKYIFKYKKSKMWLRDFSNKAFQDSENIILIRYKSAKIILILSVLIFFLNFYFVGANFYFDVLVQFLPFTYIFLLLSFLYYFFLLFSLKVTSRRVFSWGIFVILLFIVLLLALPIIFENGWRDLVDIFNNFVF